MKLSNDIRDTLVVSVDDYLETVNDDPDSTELAERVVELLMEAAEEAGIEEPTSVITALEEKAQLEEPLVDVLDYEFGRTNELELSGEEIVEFVEKLGILEFAESHEDIDDEDEDLDGLDELDELDEDEDEEEDED